jgi:hypothetical protein
MDAHNITTLALGGTFPQLDSQRQRVDKDVIPLQQPQFLPPQPGPIGSQIRQPPFPAKPLGLCLDVRLDLRDGLTLVLARPEIVAGWACPDCFQMAGFLASAQTVLGVESSGGVL